MIKNFLPKNWFGKSEPDVVLNEVSVEETYPANVEGSSEFNEVNKQTLQEEVMTTESVDTNAVTEIATPEPITYSPDYLLNAPEVVGWLSTQEQELLFSAMLLFYETKHSILDVGCGRADLFGYIRDLLLDSDIKYKGIDLNPNILKIAEEKYPGVEVEAVDILKMSEEKYDWVMASGMFNLKDQENMEGYARTVVDAMYQRANFGVVFNLLTGLPDYLPQEDIDQLHVYNSSEWLQYLIETYTKVICRSDYMSGDVTFYIFK